MGGQRPSILRRVGICLFVLLGLAATAATASAQTGSITGRVLNQGTNEYIKSAKVGIIGTDKEATTDTEGVYVLKSVPAGEVKISASYSGLDTVETTVQVVAGETASQDFKMTSADYGDVIKLTAVSVSGNREGSAKAIVEQREALNFKNVISSDAFGDIPEGNLGEYLKNVPGISVDYVEADVRNVRVRGLPPKYATLTVDGLPIANSGSSDVTRLRAIEMEQISLATTDAQEVNKSPTADMLSPGLGGNINAVSKSAFSKKGRTLKYSAGAVMNSYHMRLAKDRGWDGGSQYHVFPNYNVEFSDVFKDKLGIVFAINHSGSFQQQRILGNGLTNAPTSAAAGYTNPEGLPLYTQIQLRDGPKPTWRDSMVLNVDFKINDDLKVFMHNSYGGYNAEFYNKDFTWLAANGQFASRDFNSQSNTGASVTVGSSNSRKTGATYIYNPGFEWKSGDFKIGGAVSYSRSLNKYYAGDEDFFRTITVTKTGVNWRYDKTGDTSFQLKQTGGSAGSVFDLGSYNSATVVEEGRQTTANTYSGRLDSELNKSDWSLPVVLKAGLSYRDDTVNLASSAPTWNMALGTTGAAGTVNLRNYMDFYPAKLGMGTTVTDIGGTTTDYNPTIDNFKLYQLFKQYVTDLTGTTAPLAGSPFTAANGGAANLRSLLQAKTFIEEEITAAYVMGTVKPMKALTLLAGLRFEKTDTTGRSFSDSGRNFAATSVLRSQGVAGLGAGGTYTTTQLSAVNTNDFNFIYARYGATKDRERSYDNILPSAQAKYNLAKNINVKAAYYKSLMRPDFNNLRGGITVNDNVAAPFTFTRNNIDLNPETADNFEVGFEYYFKRIGVVGINVWHKKLKDIQIDNTTIMTDASLVPEDVLALGYTFADLGSNSTVVQRINAGSTSISGAEFTYDQELTFLPGILKGLGVKYNLSYVKPEDQNLFSSSAAAQASGGGIPTWTQNMQLNYKLKGFEFRLSVNYNSKKVLATNGVTFDSMGNPVIGSAGVQKDFEAGRISYGINTSYRLHKSAVLFLNIQNVLDESFYRYKTSYANTLRNGDYGAVYNFGVKGSF